MIFNAILTLIYACLLFVGGAIGYLKANSLPSLLMSGGFGLILCLCAWGMYKNSSMAFWSAVGTTSLLTLFFAYRFSLTHAFMPGGLMGVLSLIMLIVLLLFSRKILIPGL